MKQILKINFLMLLLMLANIAKASTSMNGAWIDIPASTYVRKICDDSNLLIAIDRYHKISKVNKVALAQRINALSKILNRLTFLKETLASKEDDKLSSLTLMASKKLWYLQQIQQIVNDPTIMKKFTNTNQMTGPYTPIFLTNKLLYDFHLPTIWGLCQLEALDPCHRMLTAHYVKWQESGSRQPFFLWLEQEEMSFRTLQVNFFSDTELKNYEIVIDKGLLCNANSNDIANYNDKNQEYIYIITLDEKIYVTSSSQTIRHSSLSHGKPILGSGSLKINKGKLTYIDTESGHYQPTMNTLLQTLMILKNKGAKIDYQKLDVMYYNEKQKKVQTKGISLPNIN